MSLVKYYDQLTGKRLTLLTNQFALDAKIIADLYKYRWQVEEDYKTLKYRLQVENFSGKTAHSVYQDFLLRKRHWV